MLVILNAIQFAIIIVDTTRVTDTAASIVAAANSVASMYSVAINSTASMYSVAINSVASIVAIVTSTASMCDVPPLLLLPPPNN
jgi:hypothetical protein